MQEALTPLLPANLTPLLLVRIQHTAEQVLQRTGVKKPVTVKLYCTDASGVPCGYRTAVVKEIRVTVPRD